MAEGIALYERALCVQPRHSDALYNLGVAYGEMGQFQVRGRHTGTTASTPLETHTKDSACVKTQSIYTMFRQGVRAVARTQRRAGACALLSHVGFPAPSCHDVWVCPCAHVCMHPCASTFHDAPVYACMHVPLVPMQRAALMYELALAFAPNCAEAHNNLGVVLRELGQLERAVECYQAALVLKPNFPQSLNNLGVVMTAQGHAAEALALLTAAVSACPTYAGVQV